MVLGCGIQYHDGIAASGTPLPLLQCSRVIVITLSLLPADSGPVKITNDSFIYFSERGVPI